MEHEYIVPVRIQLTTARSIMIRDLVTHIPFILARTEKPYEGYLLHNNWIVFPTLNNAGLADTTWEVLWNEGKVQVEFRLVSGEWAPVQEWVEIHAAATARAASNDSSKIP